MYVCKVVGSVCLCVLCISFSKCPCTYAGMNALLQTNLNEQGFFLSDDLELIPTILPCNCHHCWSQAGV